MFAYSRQGLQNAFMRVTSAPSMRVLERENGMQILRSDIVPYTGLVTSGMLQICSIHSSAISGNEFMYFQPSLAE